MGFQVSPRELSGGGVYVHEESPGRTVRVEDRQAHGADPGPEIGEAAGAAPMNTSGEVREEKRIGVHPVRAPRQLVGHQIARDDGGAGGDGGVGAMGGQARSISPS